jgi:hypothetical protein
MGKRNVSAFSRVYKRRNLTQPLYCLGGGAARERLRYEIREGA